MSFLLIFVPVQEYNNYISSILTSKDLVDYAKRLDKYGYADDCINELYLILSELDKDYLRDLVENKRLKFFCLKVIKLSLTSPSHPFYRNTIRFTTNNSDEEIRDVCDEVNDCTLKKIVETQTRKIEQKRFPTEAKLFQLYVELGDYRSVAKEVDLPVMTCYKLINEFRKQIKRNI